MFRLATLLIFWVLGSTCLATEPPVSFQPEQHICIIGNALADRMQHHGWLETYLHALHPNHQLVFRNLGFTGDEVATRPRSMNFGSADEWLGKCEADTVFCFFGFNEALRGEAHLDTFGQDFNGMLDHMLAQKYNGHTAPQLVVFGPIAHEDLRQDFLPDGTANNRLLEKTNATMKQICETRGIAFVDLYAISDRLYRENDEPLTLNGIHLRSNGNRLLAREIVAQWLPDQLLPADASLESLRQAVLHKNDYWFNRYRVVDGYNVYGGRSTLAWHGQSNFDVMQREMEVFEVMTANRDQQVWAAAQGKSVEIKDDNLPPLLAVKTNKEGPLEGGRFPYLGAEEAIDAMELHPDLDINVFASEEMFPRLINPAQISVDTDGRLWASVWPSYPHWNPTQTRQDALLILPDEDGDGVADECIVFADELNSVTGFEFWGGGVIVAAPPELWFLRDTDGDNRADLKLRILQGLSSADTHHSANAMLLGPDGWIYWSRGVFNVTNMEIPTGTFRSKQSGVYRFHPRTYEVEFHFPIGPNPHGHVFDEWGFEFANDGTSGTGSYVNIGKGRKNRQWFKKRVRPVPATGFLSGSHFPPEMRGNFLICNVIGVLGVLQHEVRFEGADINAHEIAPLVLSSDPNFRPSDLEIGGDGALYIADWHNALIGHMQHNMRDPNRDATHGRIYRMTHKGRPFVKPVKLREASTAQLFEQLLKPEPALRYRTRIELSGRPTEEVVDAMTTFTQGLEADDPSVVAQAKLECLWVCEEHQVAPPSHWMAELLSAPDPRQRAAAIRTLRTRPNESLIGELLQAAADPEALVRAEATKAGVELPPELATEVLFTMAQHPLDPELETVLAYAREEVGVDSWLATQLAAGKRLSPPARQFVLNFGSPELLTQLDDAQETLSRLLSHPAATQAQVRSAVQKLATAKETTPGKLLVKLLQGPTPADENVTTRWAVVLSEQPGEVLTELEPILQKLACDADRPGVQAVGFQAWATASGAFEVLQAVKKQPQHLDVFLQSVPSLPEQQRAQLFEPLQALWRDGDAAQFAQATAKPGLDVDYFHPSPQDVRPESLKEEDLICSYRHALVEIAVPADRTEDQFALRFSGNLIVPESGPYTFFLTSDDGSRLFIDGEELIDNDGLHGPAEQQGSVELMAGSHPLLVTYFDGGGAETLELEWDGPGFSRQSLPAAALQTGSDLRANLLAAILSIPGPDDAQADLLIQGIQQGIPAAIAAVPALSLDTLDATRMKAMVTELIPVIEASAPSARARGSLKQALVTCHEIATRTKDTELLKKLSELDVRSIELGVVPHRMMFDQPQLIVGRGQPVEIRFENTDAMPHNFVLVRPGALARVGAVSEATGRDRDAIERNYVPVSEDVLAAGTLLQSGESEAIYFTAPQEPGVYPFVCTYPGHWRRMFGALVVVDDLTAYETSPDSYLSEHGPQPQDELLMQRRASHAWTYDELVADLKQLETGRSFVAGKSLFRSASCIGCHNLGGEGQVFGPDLKELAPPRQSVEHILRSVVEPSANIDDQYRSQTFYLDSGKVVTGMVVDQTSDYVKLVVGPMGVGELCDDTAIFVQRAEIEERVDSKQSLMPEGLLDQLTREEILDLLAFVLAEGDPAHALFRSP